MVFTILFIAALLITIIVLIIKLGNAHHELECIKKRENDGLTWAERFEKVQEYEAFHSDPTR